MARVFKQSFFRKKISSFLPQGHTKPVPVPHFIMDILAEAAIHELFEIETGDEIGGIKGKHAQ